MIQIYTGDGKGKTTAAVGLALRALGAGKRVAFFQFMKAWVSHEIALLQKCGALINREWDGTFVNDKPISKQIRMVRRQYGNALKILEKGFDVVVLDEIIVTLHWGLLREEDIAKLMQKAPKEMELILTGRGATPRLIELADLVTHMDKVKHYFDKGVQARVGIEY